MKALAAAIAVVASIGAFTESALANVSIRINLGSSPVRRIYRSPINYQGYDYYRYPSTIRYERYRPRLYDSRILESYRNDNNSRVIIREVVPSQSSGFIPAPYNSHLRNPSFTREAVPSQSSGFIPAPYNSHLRNPSFLFR